MADSVTSVDNGSVVKDEVAKKEILDVDTKPESQIDKDKFRQIMLFLEANGLKETLDVFKKEVKVPGQSTAPDAKHVSRSEVSKALASYKSENEPSIYKDAYQQLLNFIEKSLDMHKCELMHIAYPVFINMYLELIVNGHEEEAMHFFATFSGIQEEFYHDDLVNLSNVTKNEHLKNDQLLEEYRSSKFTIRMMRDSYNRLKRFLKENNLPALMAIIDDHLLIDVFDGAPRNKQQLDASGGAMYGDALKDANKVKVFYGLLKEPDINIPLDDEDEEPANEEGRTSKKRKAKRDPQLMKKSKTDPNAPPLTRIPLPELKDVDKQEKVKAYREANKRINLGPDVKPSICFHTFLNSSHSTTSAEFCEDSSMLSAGFSNSDICVFSLHPSKLRYLKPPNELELLDKECDDVAEKIMDDRTATDMIRLRAHTGPVYGTSFSHDRSLLVSGSEDGTVRLWCLRTWTNTVAYKGHLFPVWDVSFCAQGRYFASAGSDRTARLWATDHIQPVRLFAGHVADVDCVRIHPNANYVATGSHDRTVRLWDVYNGGCVRVMTGHKGAVECLAFSPDGKYLASGGADNQIILWDLSNGESVTQLKSHSDAICSLGFSREGALLTSGGRDNCVKLWDVNKIFSDQEADMGFVNNVATDSKSYELGSYATKQTPVLSVHYTRRNLLFAAGPFESNVC